MKGKLQALAGALCLCALAACSHKHSNTPLTYVPADTPYVVANLKPLDADVQNALLTQVNQQLPTQVVQMRSAAKDLDRENKPHMAALMREFADEFDGRTLQQFSQRNGLDLHGLWAFYGLGLSPVTRFHITDKSKFESFLGRLEKAWGTPLETATIDKLTYRHATFNGKLPVQMIVAVNDKQATLALLPTKADDSMLRMALGLKHPEHTLADSGALDKLADSKDYLPYMLGMMDFQRLPKLMAGVHDPMFKALTRSDPNIAARFPASCQGDLARMAARVPRISFGYTTLKTKHMVQRMDVELAPDIAKAWSGIKVDLPGMSRNTATPLDIAVALPVKEIRTFWTAQANAVKAKPFTCPALTDLNKSYAELGNKIQYTAVPPFNDIRGIRISLDSLQMPDAGQGKPEVAGRVLLASDNPQGLLAIASIKAPMLRSLALKKDGKPVQLPAGIQAMTGGKSAWAAMNEHALGLAVGAGENDKLAAELKQDSGKPGMLFNMHVDGKTYEKWVRMIGKKAEAAMQKSAKPGDAEHADQLAQLKRNMQSARKQAKRVKSVDVQAQVNDKAMVMRFDTHLR